MLFPTRVSSTTRLLTRKKPVTGGLLLPPHAADVAQRTVESETEELGWSVFHVLKFSLGFESSLHFATIATGSLKVKLGRRSGFAADKAGLRQPRAVHNPEWIEQWPFVCWGEWGVMYSAVAEAESQSSLGHLSLENQLNWRIWFSVVIEI